MCIRDSVYDAFSNTNCKIEYFLILNEKTLEPHKKKFDFNRCRAFIAVRFGKIRLIDNIKL